MHRVRLFAIAASVLVHMVTPSQASKDDVQLGRMTYSAFECFMFAEMAGNKEEAERLFNVAIRAGRQFLEALTKGRLSEDEVRTQVPIGVTLKLGGPSIDFMLGRIYEGATDQAYNAIVSQDENGLPLQSRIEDKDLRRMKAEGKYLRGNCVLIR